MGVTQEDHHHKAVGVMWLFVCFCYEKHREKAAGPRKHQVWVKKITIGSQGRRMFPK